MSSERAIVMKLDQVLARLGAIEERLRRDDDELVDTNEAARILGKTANAVRQMVCRGEINADHCGRRLRFRRGHLWQLNQQTNQ